MRSRAPLSLALFFACAAAVPATSQTASPQAGSPPAGRAEVIRQADELLQAGKFAEAEAELHRAEGLAAGPCGECGLGIATVRASEGKWGESADLIQRALPLLTDPGLLARAYNQLAMAYARGAGGADRLAKAEEALRNAADYGGRWGEIARRNLAQVLLVQERWPEAVQTAREALAGAGGDEEARSAARTILCQSRSHLPDELPDQGESPRVVGEGVSRPEKIAGPAPQYTAEARLAKTEGTVVIEAVIDREGCLRQPAVIKGLSDGLGEAALAAARLWVFKPALAAGQPVPVHYTLTVAFKL